MNARQEAKRRKRQFLDGTTRAGVAYNRFALGMVIFSVGCGFLTLYGKSERNYHYWAFGDNPINKYFESDYFKRKVLYFYGDLPSKDKLDIYKMMDRNE